MSSYDFQNLLLNKQELEKALGLKIDLTQPVVDYLADYSMLEYIPLSEAINIFLGEDPRILTSNRRHANIHYAVETLVRDKKLPAKVEQEFDINGNEWRYDIYLSHDTARAYAETYGFLWNVPPYKCVKTSDLSIADNSELLHQLSKKDEEIARLKAEIESLQQSQAKISELEKQLEQAQSIQLTPVTEAKVDNYNPKERETHLKLIYALTMARTNKDFSARSYFNNKGILKPYTIMNDLIRDFEESGIQGFSADSLRKKLAEILKMEELQTMMGKNH